MLITSGSTRRSVAITALCLSTLVHAASSLGCSCSQEDAPLDGGATDAGPSLDAIVEVDAAVDVDANVVEVDATAPPGCDGDGDGFPRVSDECPATSDLPGDCDDADPRTAPGLAMCRDGHATTCGVNDELPAALGLWESSEFGTETTHVDVVGTRDEGRLVAQVVHQALGATTRAITARLGWAGWSVTLLPVDARDPATDLHLDAHAVALGRHPDTGATLLALTHADSSASLLDVGGLVSREILSAPPAPLGASGVGIVGRGTPTLVVHSRGGIETQLGFTDASGTHVIPLAVTTDERWIASAGEIVIAADPGTRTVLAVTRRSASAHAIALDADVSGRGVVVELATSHLALVPTTEGLRAIRFPHCDDAETTDCAAEGTVMPALEVPASGAPSLAAAAVGEDGLVAIASAVPATSGAPAHVEVAFVDGAAPDTVLARVVALGEGSLDGLAITAAGSVAISAGELYGGDFVLVAALVEHADGTIQQRSTGFRLCQIR